MSDWPSIYNRIYTGQIHNTRPCSFRGCEMTDPNHEVVRIGLSKQGKIAVWIEHHWLARIGWVGTVEMRPTRPRGKTERDKYRNARILARERSSGKRLIIDGYGAWGRSVVLSNRERVSR